MDIYSYLNSKDVTEHCRKINHQFNALECVFIIYHCCRLSVEEKHQLYHEIMQTMSDITLSDRQRIRWSQSRVYSASLFAALQEYISDQTEMISAIQNGLDRSVYRYTFHEKGYSGSESNILFSDYHKAQSAFLRDISECVENEDYSPFSGCVFMSILDEARSITANWDYTGRIMSIDSGGFPFDSELPGNFWAYIPVSFHKGDIVIDSLNNYPEPLVLDHIHYEGRSEAHLRDLMSHWDETDMLAWGFDRMEDLISDSPCEICGYQNLEYYRGEVSPELKEIQDKIRNQGM